MFQAFIGKFFKPKTVTQLELKYVYRALNVQLEQVEKRFSTDVSSIEATIVDPAKLMFQFDEIRKDIHTTNEIILTGQRLANQNLALRVEADITLKGMLEDNPVDVTFTDLAGFRKFLETKGYMPVQVVSASSASQPKLSFKNNSGNLYYRN